MPPIRILRRDLPLAGAAVLAIVVAAAALVQPRTAPAAITILALLLVGLVIAALLFHHRAERRENLLRDAINSISEGFVIFDRDDRFVMCNEVYRRLYQQAADLLVPGTPYEVIAGQWLARGGHAELSGDVRRELTSRLKQRRQANSMIEQHLADGRWLLVTDRPMRSGGI